MKRDSNAIIIGVLSLNLGQLNDIQKECINKTDGCPTFNDILNHVIKKNLAEIPNEIFLKSKDKERRFSPYLPYGEYSTGNKSIYNKNISGKSFEVKCKYS